MFNTPDYEALEYLFNTVYKHIVTSSILADTYIRDNDCELAKEVKEKQPYSIISLMQIKNTLKLTLNDIFVSLWSELLNKISQTI